jgi:ERCC4-type nuclease
MPDELNREIAADVVFSAIARLRPMRGGKVVSSRAPLRAVILNVIHDLAAEKRQFGELTRQGSANRPAWMDIRLDSPEDLAANRISIQPVVLKSLLDAGFRCLGDLRWVSNRELRQLRYIGIKSAQQLRDILRRMEHSGRNNSARLISRTRPD